MEKKNYSLEILLLFIVLLNGCSTPSKYVGKAMPDIWSRSCSLGSECSQSFKHFDIDYSVIPSKEGKYKIKGLLSPKPRSFHGPIARLQNLRIHFVFLSGQTIACEYKVLAHGMLHHDIKFKDETKCERPIDLVYIVGYGGTVSEL